MLPWLTVIVVVVGVMAARSSAFGATQIEWGWGHNDAGQLGDGTASSFRDPPVPGVQGVTGLAAGQGFSLALMKDGTVTAWGFNEPGLGDGKSTLSYVPVQVSGLSGVTAIAAGRFHGVALRGDGTVVAWGSNGHGQVGDGTTTDRTVPVPVSGLSGVRAIAAGGDDSLALLDDGTVMAWGQNQGGQLGDGTTVDRDVPVAVQGLNDVRAIAASGSHSLALLGDGTVMAWGNNEYGQLGNGTTTGSALPVAVTGLSGVTHLSAGSSHSLATLSDGTVTAWGGNASGELGNGTNTGPDGCGPAKTPCAKTPVAVVGLTGATAVAAGSASSLALLRSGNVMAWGLNEYGQLGIGTTTGPEQCGGVSVCSRKPVRVHRLGAVGEIAAGPRGSNLAYRAHPAAHPPDYGLCIRVAAGRGKYGDAACTTLGGTTKYEWFPGVGLARFTITRATGNVTLTTVTGSKVVCVDEKGTGEYQGADEVANVTLRFSGCKHSTSACTSPGAGEGELVTSPLLGLLGVEQFAEAPSGNRIGLDLLPMLGMTQPFLEFSCGPTNVVVRGSLIAPVISDSMRLAAPLTYTQHAGRQEPESFAEGPPNVLESSWGGGPWEQTGLQMKARQANEEKVEVNAVS